MIPLYLLGAVRPLPRAALLRVADGAAARLSDARRDALRRRDALPRAVGLPDSRCSRRRRSSTLAREREPVGGRAPSPEQLERHVERKPPLRLEQVVVVEVRVHVARQRPTTARASWPSECVVGRTPSRGAPHRAPCSRRDRAPAPRAARRRRCTSRRRRRTRGSSPRARIHSASLPDARGGIAAGRPGVRRARPVRVQAERRARGGEPRTVEPALLVLAVGGVGRPHQRDHVEAAGPPSLQRVEAPPRLVVERLLDVAGDDRGWTGLGTLWRMCGICGLYSPSSEPPPASRRRDARAHPPPRPRPGLDRRVRRRACSGTSASRCSIPSSATSRSRTRPATSIAVFNGELYNFPRAARGARSRGHEVRGRGDTPVIPHLYEEHGVRLRRAARRDVRDRALGRAAARLVLARDRLGKKPLVWTRLADGTLAFASELKAFRGAPRLPRRARSRRARRLPRAAVRPGHAHRPARRPAARAGLARSSSRAAASASSATGSRRVDARDATDDEWLERVRAEVTRCRAEAARRPTSRSARCSRAASTPRSSSR